MESETTLINGANFKSCLIYLKERISTMKKVNLFIIVITIISFLYGCNSNVKLTQESAEKGIRSFLSSTNLPIIDYGSDGMYHPRGYFNSDAIISIDPISQFSENEASTIVHFNEKQCVIDQNNLKLKFTLKKNIDEKWILTSVTPATNEYDDPFRTLSKWCDKNQNINIPVQ